MSKWIYSQKNKMFWNLDKVLKIRLESNRIELVYDEDGGSNYVEFDTEKDLLEAWRCLKIDLLLGKD